jgi:hypothetical protein
MISGFGIWFSDSGLIVRLRTSAGQVSDWFFVVVWGTLGPVFANTVPDKAIAFAERKLDHGRFRHAPARVQVDVPGPARSFSAVVGILSDSPSPPP